MLSSGRCTRVAVESEPQNLWQFRNPHLLMLLWFVVASLATFGQSTVVSTPSAICAMAEISWFHGAVWTPPTYWMEPTFGDTEPQKGHPPKGGSFVSRFPFSRRKEMCIPAHWSAPIIDGQGTVLVGRSDGKLYQAGSPRSFWTLVGLGTVGGGPLGE